LNLSAYSLMVGWGPELPLESLQDSSAAVVVGVTSVDADDELVWSDLLVNPLGSVELGSLTDEPFFRELFLSV